MRKSFIAGVLLCAGSWTEAAAVENLQESLERFKKEILSNAMAAPALQRFAVDNLLPQSANPVFIREVKAQNARKVPLSKIQSRDKEWMSSPDDAPFKAALLGTEASKELRRFSGGHAAIREAFVMDDQGAVVGETNVTSDYWQGDEKKWSECYKEGRGAVYIAAAQFDASVNMVLQQISLPVLDGDGAVIGAITWGVILEKIDWKKSDDLPTK